MLIKAVISLNGREREVICNQNQLTEYQHNGYVLERIISETPMVKPILPIDKVELP